MSISRIFRTEVAFDSKATDSFPLWTDVSPWMKRAEAGRGRSYELDKIEAGEASYEFDNLDFRFTPGRSVSTLLLDNFSAIGAIGSANASFTSDSGVWFNNPTSGNRTVTSTVDGVLVSSDSVLVSGGNIELKRFGVTGNYFTADVGVTVTVTYRARVMNATNTTTVRSAMFPEDAGGAGLAVSSSGITTVTSNGAWVTGSDTFVVPAGTARIRVGVRGAHAAGSSNGALSLEVASIKVTVPAPYAGKLRTRNPIRSYTVLDDNWLHYECVNASLLDLNAPRWWAVETAPRRGANVAAGRVTSFFSSQWNKPVFSFLPPASGGGAFMVFRHGLEGDSDPVYVQAGQTITADADLIRLGTSPAGTSARLNIYLDDSNSVTAPLVTSSDVWEHRSVSWVAPRTGYYRLSLSMENQPTSRFRATNLKLRLDNVGSASCADASGLYPHFRGWVEKWSSVYNGTVPTATATAVDALTVADQPVTSIWRYGLNKEVLAPTVGLPVGKTWYWSCVEDSGSSVAHPTIGTDTLSLVVTDPAPSTGGFTGDKTMVYSDGMDNSGGFTVSSDQTAQGALLKMSNPSQLATARIDVAMWYRGDVPAANDRMLFGLIDSAGTVHMGLWVQPGGAVRGYLSPGNSGGITLNSSSAANKVKQNQPHHIRIKFDGLLPTLDVYVDGVNVMSATGTASRIMSIPAAVFFGGYNWGGVQNQFINGTINHIVVSTSLISDTLWTNAYNWGAPRIDTESARMALLLDMAGWPGSSNIDPAASTLIADRWEDGASLVGELGNAAESAGGLVFAGPAGELSYQNRFRRAGATPRWTLQEWNDGLLFELDEARLFNIVRAERSTGLVREVRDADSVLLYGPKLLKATRDVTSDTEVADAAAWLLHRYRENRPRCESLFVDATPLAASNAAVDAQLLALAHGANISDLMSFPGAPDGGPDGPLSFFIEGVKSTVELDGSVYRYGVTLQVSDATRSDAWVLEDGTSGVLDAENCVVCY